MKSFFKFTPIMLLAALMIGIPESIPWFNISMPFHFQRFDALIAAPIATGYAIIVARIADKDSVHELIGSAIHNVQSMQMVFFILMFAYAMADAFMQTGVGASIVNVAISLGLNGRFVAPAALLVSAILSVATGSSWGTFAACAPVFLWLSHIVGGDVLLTTGAIAGGACFGDSISLVADTTVVSCGIQRVDIVDRIRHQLGWAILCMLLALGLTIFLGFNMGLPTETGDVKTLIDTIPRESMNALAKERPAAAALLNQVKHGVPLYMIAPLVLVIAMSLFGAQTLVCLGSGIVLSLVLGLLSGTVQSVVSYLEMVKAGFSSAGGWVIVMMMWVGAFSGVMAAMDAFGPLIRLVKWASRSVRSMMTMNGIMCLFGNAVLADEMAEIVTVGPIIRRMVEENVEGSPKDLYMLRLRNATLSASFGVYGSQLIPWHVYLIFTVGIATAVYPFHQFSPIEIIRSNYLAMISVASLLLFTWTGLDRLIPMFRLPSEPAVRLKRE